MFKQKWSNLTGQIIIKKKQITKMKCNIFPKIKYSQQVTKIFQNLFKDSNKKITILWSNEVPFNQMKNLFYLKKTKD